MIDKDTIKEIGRHIVVMTRNIDNDERHLVAKLMDTYFQIPYSHKYQMLKHLLQYAKMSETWVKFSEDDTRYMDVFREIIWYFSGRGEVGQPCKKDLRRYLLSYVSSKYCSEALEDTLKDKDKDRDKSFKELLTDL